MAMNSPVDMGASPNPGAVFGGFGGAPAVPVAPSFPSMPALAPAPAPAAAAPASAGFTFGAAQSAPAPAMTFGGGGFGGGLRATHDTSNTTQPHHCNHSPTFQLRTPTQARLLRPRFRWAACRPLPHPPHHPPQRVVVASRWVPAEAQSRPQRGAGR